MSLASTRYHILTEPRYKQLRPFVRIRDVDVSHFRPPPVSYITPINTPSNMYKRTGTGWVVFTIIVFLILFILLVFLIYFFLLGGAKRLGINIGNKSIPTGNNIISGLGETCEDKPCVNPFVCNSDNICKSNLHGPCTVNSDCFSSTAVCSQGQCRNSMFESCDLDIDCAQGLDCVNNQCTQL